jgi:hypothetical protein
MSSVAVDQNLENNLTSNNNPVGELLTDSKLLSVSKIEGRAALVQERNYYDSEYHSKHTQKRDALDFTEIPRSQNGNTFDYYEKSPAVPKDILQAATKPLPLQMLVECEVAVNELDLSNRKPSLTVTFRSIEEFDQERAKREIRLNATFNSRSFSKLLTGEYQLRADNPVPEFDCLAGDINVMCKKAFREAVEKVGLKLSDNGKYVIMPVSQEIYNYIREASDK